MADKTIEILLKLNDQMGSQLEMNTRLMNEAAVAADKLSQNVKGTSDSLNKSASEMDGHNIKSADMISSMAKIAGGFLVVDKVAGFVKDTLFKSLEAWDESAQAVAELDRALGFSSDAINAQAEALQNSTRYEDDATRRAAARLAVYTQEEDQILTLIPLIQDFATAKRMDLESATELVSKSIFGETNMLGRYGVSLGEADTKTEKLAAATKELTEKFQGAAETSASVGTGGFVTLKNSLGDLYEEVGERASPAFNNLAENLKQIVIEWKDVISEQENQKKSSNEMTQFTQKMIQTENKLNDQYALRKQYQDDIASGNPFTGHLATKYLETVDKEIATLEYQKKAQETVLAGMIKLAKQKADEAKNPKPKPKEISDADLKAQKKAMETANKAYEQMLYERSLIGLSEQEAEIAERTKYWDTLIETDKAGGARHLAELKALKQIEIDTLRSGLPATGQVMDISGIYAPSAGTSYVNGQNTGGDAAGAAAQAAQERNQKAISDRQAEADKMSAQVRTGGLSAEEREREEFAQRKALFEEFKLSTEELERQHQENLVAIEQESQQKRLAAYSQFFGGMAALMTAVAGENKALQRAAQVAATIQATIDTYAAANKALASYPPPLSYVAAAGAVAYGMANVAQINKLHFAQGTMSPSASFGRVGGTSYSGDQVPIMVNSREGVLTSQQMDEYEGFKRGGVGGATFNITYAPVYSSDTPDYKRAQDQLNFARTVRGIESNPTSKRLQPSLS